MSEDKVESRTVDGWMIGGEFYCDRNCAGGGIPFGFVPEGSLCRLCGKVIGARPSVPQQGQGVNIESAIEEMIRAKGGRWNSVQPADFVDLFEKLLCQCKASSETGHIIPCSVHEISALAASRSEEATPQCDCPFAKIGAAGSTERPSIDELKTALIAERAIRMWICDQVGPVDTPNARWAARRQEFLEKAEKSLSIVLRPGTDTDVAKEKEPK